MTYASIMVGLDRGDAAPGRARLAARLADRFQARLIGLAARRPSYAGGYSDLSGLGEPMMDELHQEAMDDLGEVEDVFRAAAGERHGVEWRSACADPEVFLEAQAHATDIVVIGRMGSKDLSDSHMSLNAGVALMTLGRPVLIVPPSVEHLSARCVVVAWKDTCQTRRALSDAMPLLKLAEKVRVVRVADDAGEDLADVVRFLGYHNVNAIPFRISADGAGVAEALLRAAKDFDADLIVSGAYGHNRIREWFLGGVTRALLDRSPVCCLMSH